MNAKLLQIVQLCPFQNCLKPKSCKASLLKHLKTCHLFCEDDENRIHRDIFVCDICERVFFSKAMLTYHLNLTHKFRRRTVPCPKCAKSVTCLQASIHFEGHMLASVYSCPICFLKFNARKDLHSHVRSYHPCSYRCNMCSYESKKHTNLVFHKEKVHQTKSCDGIDMGVVKKCFVKGAKGKAADYVAPLATKGVTLKGNVKSIVQSIKSIVYSEKVS